MNYIHKLQKERDDLHEALQATRGALTIVMSYLETPKFHGVDNDYVQVSTDIAPKLAAIRALTVVLE